MPLLRRQTESTEIPKPVQEKITRGRERMRQDANSVNMWFKFWRGKQTVYVTSENQLASQPTVTNPDGSGKPRHRVRQSRNLIIDVVANEVSASTQRIPSYQISASTVDPEDIAAARMSEKVALYGYDKWNIRRATVKVVTSAIVGREGFAWPYFDTTVGAPVGVDEYGPVSEGEVCIRTFGPNEVYWEPGVRFEDSRWHCVEQARPLEEVKALPGYFGGDLKADAGQSEVIGEKETKAKKLALITEYLERPSLMNPTGMRLIMASGKLICPPENYPCCDGKGNYIDEPCLHKLSYFIDPDSDRDMGLVQHLIDAQRSYNDCTNKSIEWKNLALNPQILAPKGSMQQRVTDEPGAVFTFKPIGGQVPTWRPVPPIPQELFTIADQADRDIRRIASQFDIPRGVSAAYAISAILDREQGRRGDFFANVADFHSRLMRHCLYLVQRYYSEPRLLKIRGRFGPESIEDFRGSDLRDQADVYVLPDSIEPRTRSSIEQKIWNMFQTGLISKEQAVAALQGGYGEKLIDSYELDVARANRIIQKIRTGPQAFLADPMKTVTNADGQVQEVPTWMPRPFDNIAVHKAVFEDWQKTEEYELSDPAVQEAANLYYQALLQLEREQQARAAAQQMMQAQGLGMQNAAVPQTKPMPSLPSTNGASQDVNTPPQGI